jgi:hypothetical protein
MVYDESFRMTKYDFNCYRESSKNYQRQNCGAERLEALFRLFYANCSYGF